MATETRRRSRRLELRTTPAERDLIDRAAALTETDLTEFVVATAVEAARRALADRDRFELDDEARAVWEVINARRVLGSCPGWLHSWADPLRSRSDAAISAARGPRRPTRRQRVRVPFG